jgi:hypothetical protein
MTTCGMIWVTPYVVAEPFGGSKTAFKHMGLLKRGIGIVMKRYER